jgi:uncharacterized membrane protein
VLPPRRHDISRLEAFSDAVFGFALALLAVSSDPPLSYAQLIDRMYGAVSFACCFALLVWIWHEHNMFFRRYGLQDGITTTLNAMLLFVVLFYVYPLKFMFDSMFAQFLPPSSTAPIVQMSLRQLGTASAIYGAGFLVLFLLFAAMYARAWAKRDELGLTPLEVFDARVVAGHHLVSAGIGAIALIFALAAPARVVFFSPMMFALMGPAHYAFGRWTEGRRRAYLDVVST